MDRHRKRWLLISECGVRRNDFRTPRWLSTVFVFKNLDIMLGLQSRDKWSLNICDAIEIKSKGFDASSVIIQYVQNFTSTLKLRSALFSWLVWVVFLAMRKVTALQVALHHRHDGYANPERVGICTWTFFSIAIHHSSLGRAVNNFSTQIMTSARMTAVRYIECDFFIQQSCYETTCTIRWIIQSITCSYLHVWFLYLTAFSFMHTWWWYLTLVVVGYQFLLYI